MSEIKRWRVIVFKAMFLASNSWASVSVQYLPMMVGADVTNVSGLIGGKVVLFQKNTGAPINPSIIYQL